MSLKRCLFSGLRGAVQPQWILGYVMVDVLAGGGVNAHMTGIFPAQGRIGELKGGVTQ